MTRVYGCEGVYIFDCKLVLIDVFKNCTYFIFWFRRGDRVLSLWGRAYFVFFVGNLLLVKAVSIFGKELWCRKGFHCLNTSKNGMHNYCFSDD
ncbi:MAG: hypothetical protein QW831_07620, partial [Candidatus Jordarchaeaceae archaeon]